VSLTKLGDLFRDHAIWRQLRGSGRMRVKQAAEELLSGRTRWPRSVSGPGSNRNRCSTANSSTRCG
jgi:hypothetical protein